jgi:hypothetical protein
VIRILINHDRIAIPNPVADEAIVVRRNPEVETVKPESFPVSTPQVEDVPPPEAASEVPMLPRSVQVIMRIIAPRIMSDPLIITVNVWRFRMSRLVGKSAAFRGTASGRLLNSSRRRSLSRNVPTPKTMTTATLFFMTTTLTKSRYKDNRRHRHESDRQFHKRPPVMIPAIEVPPLTQPLKYLLLLMETYLTSTH